MAHRTRPAPGEGGSRWWAEVDVCSFASGFDRAERAWKNWLDSFAGKRAGRWVGCPKFKNMRCQY
ncbi:hypothetical protein ACFV98_37995 [Streptomyces violascens]|uniref:hypothetical protein n=1 Tax=Streptomyces violascens TaxID=67381 RepID=UPI0036553F0F